jgi:hypothetical protein
MRADLAAFDLSARLRRRADDPRAASCPARSAHARKVVVVEAAWSCAAAATGDEARIAAHTSERSAAARANPHGAT